MADPNKARKWTVLGDPKQIIDVLYQRVEHLEEENSKLRAAIQAFDKAAIDAVDAWDTKIWLHTLKDISEKIRAILPPEQ